MPGLFIVIGLAIIAGLFGFRKLFKVALAFILLWLASIAFGLICLYIVVEPVLMAIPKH